MYIQLMSHAHSATCHHSGQAVPELDPGSAGVAFLILAIAMILMLSRCNDKI